MISKRMAPLVANTSAIREMFEEGKRRAKIYGPENVYDFSIGNPNVPAPPEVNKSIIDIIRDEDTQKVHGKVHGYMNNAGFEETRIAIAENLNKRFGTDYDENNICMTVGCACAINVLLKAMTDPGDEFLVLEPYFFEYPNYVHNYDGEAVFVPASKDGSFMPDLDAFEKAFTPKTKGVIINNPNNPTGVVYTEDCIKKMAAIMDAKQKEFGTVIYMISDEPYREIAYDGIKVPFLPNYYDNALVGYSYSKSLSLPGERIGYAVVPNKSDNHEEFFKATVIANRVSGSVNAPSLMQLVIERCVDCQCDVSFYDRNGKDLYKGLTEAGFECVKPQGAFYLWMKSPVPDEREFIEAAKKYNILLVPGYVFGGPGYVRISFCVSHEQIMNSLPKFRELAKEYF
jgi:Aspartate/tyrosine/aromatic aminotransferase